MARLWYGGTPADFVVSQGAVAEVLDEDGNSTGDTGSAVLLPVEATGFTAYTDAALSSSTSDLLDGDGSPISEVTPETDYARRGGIPAFQGPDEHEGPLYLSADGQIGYRLEPDSGSLYARVGDLEGGLSDLTVRDLDDWSDDSPTDGDVPRWNNSLGVWEPIPVNPGGASELSDLSDVDLAGASAGTTLVRGSDGTYRPGSPAGGVAWDDVTGRPSTFPPSSHQHTSTQISDATSFGLNVLTASSALAARAAIGASDLQLGTSETTAAPGDHLHDERYVQASSAQTSYLTFVDVSTGGESRPSGAGRVIWIGGSAEPDNMTSGDVWLQAGS